MDLRTEVGRSASANENDVNDAITAAHDAFPAWRQTSWEGRADCLAKVARLIREKRFALASLLMTEMGKNRTEALGEVEETADLIDDYNERMLQANGLVAPMGRLSEADTNTSALRPYGPWAVIARPAAP